MFVLLECRGKEHNCPVAQEDKVEGIPDYFEMCEKFQRLLNVIFLEEKWLQCGE